MLLEIFLTPKETPLSTIAILIRKRFLSGGFNEENSACAVWIDRSNLELSSAQFKLVVEVVCHETCRSG